MAIPGPVDEEEWSDDKFDGYIERMEMARAVAQRVRSRTRVRENTKLCWGKMYVMSLSKRVEFPLTCTHQVVLNQPETEHHFTFSSY